MRRIAIIGAGNLATQIAMALQQCGNEIVSVYSRTEKSARLLADKLSCSYTTAIAEVPTDAHLYLFAVKDSVLAEVITQMPPTSGVWAHTAGSIPLSIFAESSHQAYGVFYPLQTFSKARSLDVSIVPFFIEGESIETTATLFEVAQMLSNHVYKADSTQRKGLHLAAVFACNFTNHMYHIAADILAEQELPFEALLPLINETANKVTTITPQEAQTGPAVRYDENVINRHISLLHNNQLKELYSMLTNSIHTLQSEKIDNR